MNFRSKDEWQRWYYSAKAQGICTNCGREKAAKAWNKRYDDEDTGDDKR